MIGNAGVRALADCLKHCANMKELKWAYYYDLIMCIQYMHT